MGVMSEIKDWGIGTAKERLNPKTIFLEAFETATDRVIPQGAAEVAQALFVGNAYVPYGPGQEPLPVEPVDLEHSYDHGLSMHAGAEEKDRSRDPLIGDLTMFAAILLFAFILTPDNPVEGIWNLKSVTIDGNVFTHDLSLGLAQFPVTDGKPTEPQALKAGLAELLKHDTFVQIFTADALFMQRPLAKVILEAGRDFLFTVKENQPDLREAFQTSFQGVETKPPDAESTKKKGRNPPPNAVGH